MGSIDGEVPRGVSLDQTGCIGRKRCASETPRRLEYALVAFAMRFALWDGAAFAQSGRDLPFSDYHSNWGIKAIGGVALAINLSIMSAVFLWQHGRVSSRLAERGILCGCIIGALLPWMELWWGSTFYYGEVRDKQGLPDSVTNFGTLGSLVLLGYVAARIPLPIATASWRRLARLGLFLGLGAIQRMTLAIVDGPWNLFQS